MPHPVDQHVGGRLRLRRRLAGISQERLAEKLGITFQQVQKYERGANRISASKLYEAATALGVPLSYFFEGLPGSGQTGSEATAPPDFFLSAEGLELAQLFPRIRRPRIRRAVIELVHQIGETGEE